MDAKARQKDRRRLNVAVPVDRRRPAPKDRRRCPACDTVLDQVVRTVRGGTVTASTCPSCGWSRSSRQADADVLILKMAWPLRLEERDGGLSAAVPPELAAALKAKAGDVWTFSPATSPLGGLPMTWTVSVAPAGRRKLAPLRDAEQ